MDNTESDSTDEWSSYDELEFAIYNDDPPEREDIHYILEHYHDLDECPMLESSIVNSSKEIVPINNEFLIIWRI